VTQSFIAHKFGGTSVQDAARIAHVGALLAAREDAAQVIVVSAMKGVTDALIELVRGAAASSPEWEGALHLLEERHTQAVAGLLGTDGGALDAELRAEFAELGDILRAQARIGAVSNDILALVSGLGEVWSARLLAAWFRSKGLEAEYLDARDALVVRDEPLGMAVDWEASGARSRPGARSAPARA
jgi:aspartokinase/homoserine dehydrogenase 1